jgi:Ran GTPase-activating protein (RanGAP) involved in mRNA processing and transport
MWSVSRQQQERSSEPELPSTFTCLRDGTARPLPSVPQDAEVAEDLERLDELDRLVWSNKGVGDETMSVLGRALASNNTVRYLFLDGCKVENMDGLVEALESNRVLTTLNLRGNRIGCSGASALFDAISVQNRLTDLNISHNCVGGFAKGQWKEEYVWDPAVLKIAQCLQAGSSLLNLDLSGNGIGVEGVRCFVKADAFGENCRLQQLGLGGNQIGGGGNEGIELLAEALHNNSTIVALDLSGNSIGIEGGKFIGAILANSALTKIDLSKNTLGDEGTSEIAHTLSTNDTLQTISLRHNLVCDGGIAAMAEALKINSTLTELDLAGNNIEDAGANSIAHILKAKDTKIAILDLSTNSIGGGEGFYQLSECLLKDKCLLRLSLQGCNLHEDDSELVAECLKHNQALTALDLSGNIIGKNGAEAFGSALPKNKWLTDLNLSNTEIGADGATSLALGLRDDCGICTLVMHSNGVGDEGVLPLVKVLKNERNVPGLTQLDLSRNGIRSEHLSVIRMQLEDRMDALGMLDDDEDDDGL